MTRELLDVQLHLLQPTQALESALALLDGEGSHSLVTVNPEFLVASKFHSSFRKALNKADISLVDGVGIVWGLEFVNRFPQWLYHTNHRMLQKVLAIWWWIVTFIKFIVRIIFIPQAYSGRVAGSDLIQELFKRLEYPHSVYVIGGLPGTQDQLREALKKQYPQMNIRGVEYGLHSITIGPDGILYDPIEDERLSQRIQSTAPTVLVVGFGQIKQELWISDHILKYPSVKLFIGVGGALDFISGAARRAPRWMREHGLEWLWRLVTEPRRFGRIITATVRFPILVLKHQWHQLSLYSSRTP